MEDQKISSDGSGFSGKSSITFLQIFRPIAESSSPDHPDPEKPE
jgi:hypothetical protein